MSNQVKIGPQVFEIIVKPDLRRGDEGLDGWIQYHNSTISLDARLEEFAYKQVIWHEIVHGILNNAGIKTVTEETVDALSYGILDVIQSNPWLTKEEK